MAIHLSLLYIYRPTDHLFAYRLFNLMAIKISFQAILSYRLFTGPSTIYWLKSHLLVHWSFTSLLVNLPIYHLLAQWPSLPQGQASTCCATSASHSVVYWPFTGLLAIYYLLAILTYLSFTGLISLTLAYMLNWPASHLLAYLSFTGLMTLLDKSINISLQANWPASHLLD